MADAEAEGFRETTLQELGAEETADFRELVLKELGYPKGDLELLLKARDYVRIIGSIQLYDVERTQALIARVHARMLAGQSAELPIGIGEMTGPSSPDIAVESEVAPEPTETLNDTETSLAEAEAELPHGSAEKPIGSSAPIEPSSPDIQEEVEPSGDPTQEVTNIGLPIEPFSADIEVEAEGAQEPVEPPAEAIDVKEPDPPSSLDIKADARVPQWPEQPSAEPLLSQSAGEVQVEPVQLSYEQIAQRMADLERENQQLRDQLLDSERRRIAAEDRIEFLEGTITHLAGLTRNSKVLDYSMTVEAEGKRMVWRSRDARREQDTISS